MRLMGVFLITISFLASQGNEHTVKFMLKRKVMLHCTEKATLETESSRKNSAWVQLKMGFQLLCNNIFLHFHYISVRRHYKFYSIPK